MDSYNYILTSNGELYHHGIKGQKWGVRRFQNKDGSLTPAGKKRLSKNEAYRDKLVGKAEKRVKKYNARADEAKANISDLKNNGKNSAAYRRWKEDEYEKRQAEYEENHKIKGPDGQTYVKSYARSADRFVDDVIDGILADTTIDKLINENKEVAKRNQDKAKRWTNNKSDLMNMNVSALTKKSEIRKTYRSGSDKTSTSSVKNTTNDLKKQLSSGGKDLDAPYAQEIAPGVHANWPTKRAYLEAEIKRLERDKK